VLEYRILGPLEVVREDGALELGGTKPRATLAILLLQVNRVVSIDRLADDLYGGAAPATALKQVQRQVSDLRRALGPASSIETRSPGYTIRLEPEQLDLTVFERLTADAAEAFAEGKAESASELLQRALDLWRGAPLADLTYEEFARAPVERLEEIRLAAHEQRIEADLACGRHTALVGELQDLVIEHPLRERFTAQLILALYRSGRQAEALEAYRRTRDVLIDEFGLEPTPALQQLERRVLEQDPLLNPALISGRHPSAEESNRAVLVAPTGDTGLDRLLALAAPLARSPGRELIVARLVVDADDLDGAHRYAAARRELFDVQMRVAAFTSRDTFRDLRRLADAYDVELVLVDSPGWSQLESSSADLAVALGEPVDWARGGGVFVPFGGSDHDWSALELAAWLASAAGVPLRLVGARGRTGDASRLLANASVAVQRLVGIDAAPLLAEPSVAALADAVSPATLVVMGVSKRAGAEGLGTVRGGLVDAARSPLVLVHAGPRPGGLAPRDVRTRFSWSLEN
jgi:DNA-binding SARP family transcriptional activator